MNLNMNKKLFFPVKFIFMLFLLMWHVESTLASSPQGKFAQTLCSFISFWNAEVFWKKLRIDLCYFLKQWQDNEVKDNRSNTKNVI